MSNPSRRSPQLSKISPLLVTGLMVAGNFQFIPAALALTTAGSQIRNTATATYTDPNNPNVPINATSNTVTVTVAEVAGLTVTDDAAILGIDSNSDGTITPNDVIYFDFLVTNTGNDPTTLFIPGKTNITLTGAGTIAATDNVQIIGTVLNGVRTNLGTAVTVPAAGSLTGSSNGMAILGLSDAGANTGAALKPNDSIIVRIPVQVNALAPSGAVITARLGDTAPNDNTANTQNQADLPDTALATEVRTFDNDAVTGDAVGAPSNGEREASRFQSITVGSVDQAFATLRKTNGGVNNNATPATLTDDIITYNLTLDVENTVPAGATGFTPGDLGPQSAVNIDGQNRSVILISDAIPASTKLQFGGAVTDPGPQWIPVYTSTGTATNANAATWSTTAPANQTAADAITRIGFVYDGDGDGDLATTTPTAANTIAAGTTFTGFSFQVIASGIPAAGGNVANIAQIFGTTDNDGDGTPTNDNPVYDESGDSTPSNFNDNGSLNPSDNPATPAREDITNGVAVPANDGIDSGNNNTGTGTGGEDNVVTLALPGAILNGPNGLPGAVGPNDNTDDFTNQSVAVNAANSVPNSTPDPTALSFTNTVNNPGTSALTNVLIVPDTFEPTATDAGANNFFDTIALATLTGAGNPGMGGGTAIVPVGTTVTLTFGTQTAIYQLQDFNNTPANLTDDNFVFTGGTGPIVISTLPAGGSVNYTVSVDLPATALGADSGLGLDIPIYAFTDTNSDGRPTTGTAGVLETTANRTIDRVYVGYLRLKKEQRLLEADGTTQVEGFTDGSLTTANVRPGRIIEYRITYANISVVPTGTGNVVLNASNVVITENGTTGTNNWAEDPAGGTGSVTNPIVTSHVTNGANALLGSITYNPSGQQVGLTQSTDVVEYINAVGVNIIPGQSGTFTFQRKIN